MYVCICKEVTQQSIVDAIKSGANSIEELQNLLGPATECGACYDFLQELLDEYGQCSTKEDT